MRLFFLLPPRLYPVSFSPSPSPRDSLYGLICGDVKIAKINTELLTLNIQTIDWAGPSQMLDVLRTPPFGDEGNEKLIGTY